MPNIFKIGSYFVYFWSNENSEPIHVHVSRGKPSANSTKIWLTSSGHCLLAKNNSHIPQNELNDLMDIIEVQFSFICEEWKRHFVLDQLTFYC